MDNNAKKNLQIGIRIDEDMRKRLESLESSTGINPSSIARSGLEAVLRYFERNEELLFPLFCISEKEHIRLLKIEEAYNALKSSEDKNASLHSAAILTGAKLSKKSKQPTFETEFDKLLTVVPVRVGNILLENIEETARYMSIKKQATMRLCMEIGVKHLKKVDYDLATVILETSLLNANNTEVASSVG